MSAADQDRSGRAPARILVVDDEPDILAAMEHVLAFHGFETGTASSGAAALEAIEQRPFDLVLTDLRMPGMSGSELLTELLRRDPAARVVVITGYASDETQEESRRSGALDCITKPVDIDDLVAAVERALQQPR